MNAFTHRCVRDLAWVIASPPLISGTKGEGTAQSHWWDHQQCLEEFADCLSALQQLDQNPEALITHLESIKSKRLGLRFEGLIAFWLDAISPNYQLLARNLQLNEVAGDTRSRTIGEIDFIIKELKTDKIIHLEVAVKFYLGTAPFSDPYRWFGTNTSDQLGKKAQHLLSHQTQLSLHHPEQLPFAIDERHCLLKGRLFYPYETEAESPIDVTKNHLRGRYIHAKNKQITGRFIALEKQEWMAELTTEDIAERTILQTWKEPERAYCYAQIVKQKEIERVFVLPNDFVFPSDHKVKI